MMSFSELTGFQSSRRMFRHTFPSKSMFGWKIFYQSLYPSPYFLAKHLRRLDRVLVCHVHQKRERASLPNVLIRLYYHLERHYVIRVWPRHLYLRRHVAIQFLLIRQYPLPSSSRLQSFNFSLNSSSTYVLLLRILSIPLLLFQTKSDHQSQILLYTLQYRSQYVQNYQFISMSLTFFYFLQFYKPIFQYPTTEDQITSFFHHYQPRFFQDFHILPNLTLQHFQDSIYYGQLLNSKRHGKGILFQQTGQLYEGEWENDFKHGRGYESYPNGSQYEGYYVNGKPEGVGKFIWKNGEIYEGQWQNGKKHGSGIWKGNKGDSYIGEWKLGQADGCGVHIWVNGDRFEGEFRNSVKSGYGQEKFANGDTYIGNYDMGKPHGEGEYYWANGAVYKGSFKHGLRHGKGIWAKGTGITDKYEGEYKEDKKDGYGVFSWADGSKYEGEYADDVRNGQGTMLWNDGSFYRGNWKNGIQEGEGEMYVNGQPIMKGVFKGNQLQKAQDEKQQSNALQNYQQKQQQHLASQLRELHRQQYSLHLQQQELQKKQLNGLNVFSPETNKTQSKKRPKFDSYGSMDEEEEREQEGSEIRDVLSSEQEGQFPKFKKLIDNFTQTQEFEVKKKEVPQSRTERIFYPKIRQSQQTQKITLFDKRVPKQPRKRQLVNLSVDQGYQLSKKPSNPTARSIPPKPKLYMLQDHIKHNQFFIKQTDPKPSQRSTSPPPSKNVWIPSGVIRNNQISKKKIKPL